jgi:predicted type IV restriction endonuclease
LQAYSNSTFTLTKQDKTQYVELNVTKGTEVEIITNFKYNIRVLTYRLNE